jgi:hypothetical protein
MSATFISVVKTDIQYLAVGRGSLSNCEISLNPVVSLSRSSSINTLPHAQKLIDSLITATTIIFTFEIITKNLYYCNKIPIYHSHLSPEVTKAPALRIRSNAS